LKRRLAITEFGLVGMITGQLVAWPQAVRALRVQTTSLSLATYVLLMVSMSLYFVHASTTGDVITCVSVPLALIPNGVILARIVIDRRRTSHGDSSIGVVKALAPPQVWSKQKVGGATGQQVQSGRALGRPS
jgi:uncharacterized protein with PQ loop repeat